MNISKVIGLLIISSLTLLNQVSLSAKASKNALYGIPSSVAGQNYATSTNLQKILLSSSFQVVRAQTGSNTVTLVLINLIVLGTGFGAIAYFLILGVIRIEEDKVGIVIKKIDLNSSRKLPTGKIIATDGEAGIQAEILQPGVHHGYPRFRFTILKEDLVVIPQGEIALVIAQDGAPMAAERALGKAVPCNDFQDAKAFFDNGGEKGQQLSFLTTGTYRINTKLFTIITVANAPEYELKPEQLKPCVIPSDSVGIVTAHDGTPIPSGDIAGPIIEGHAKFQDPQKFIDNGGCRGLQQDLLPSGSWDINPWFAEVEKVPLVEIPNGTVGVVISHVGEIATKHSDDGLVDDGFKGVWRKTLKTGKHPINTKVMSVEIVPIHEIALDWRSDTRKSPSNYDSGLYSLNLRAQDGFAFNIEVTQVIKVPEESAPRMISRVGSPMLDGDGHPNHRPSGPLSAPKYTSIRNLVTRVLKPMVETHFRNSVQQYGALEFLDERSDRQKEALVEIREGLRHYGVEAVGTFLSEIDLPPDLEKTLTERKISEQKKKTYITQKEAEVEKQELVRLQEYTKIQKQFVQAEIAEQQAQAQRTREKAEVETLREKIAAFGAENYTAFQIMETISKNKMRLVPELSFDSSDNYGTTLLQWLVGSFLKSNTDKEENSSGLEASVNMIIPEEDKNNSGANNNSSKNSSMIETGLETQKNRDSNNEKEEADA
ncbi:SPFH domain-containing protein [Leptothoe sp. ISB3NOV94-8A]